MMHFIGFNREEEAEKWARKHIGIEHPVGFFRAISAVDENDKFACVAVMTNFTSRNIDINIAISNRDSLSPRSAVLMFNEIFSYAFDTLRAVRVTALSRSKNQKANKFIEHIGFKPEGTMRKAFQDDDLNIYGFLAEEYYSHAWYRGKNG